MFTTKSQQENEKARGQRRGRDLVALVLTSQDFWPKDMRASPNDNRRVLTAVPLEGRKIIKKETRNSKGYHCGSLTVGRAARAVLRANFFHVFKSAWLEGPVLFPRAAHAGIEQQQLSIISMIIDILIGVDSRRRLAASSFHEPSSDLSLFSSSLLLLEFSNLLFILLQYMVSIILTSVLRAARLSRNASLASREMKF